MSGFLSAKNVVTSMLAASITVFAGEAGAGPGDPLNEVSGTEDWEKDDASKRARQSQKDDFKEHMRDWEVLRKRSAADKEEVKQERIIFQSVSSGFQQPVQPGYVPAAPPPGRQDDWMREEADALEKRYRKGQPASAAPAAPRPAPVAAPVPAKPAPAPSRPATAWPDEMPALTPAEPASIPVIRGRPPAQPPSVAPQPRPAPVSKPAPPPPPPPPPKKEETTEDILKKQKGHFDDSSGQFVDDELMEETKKKKK
ncbi:MAG: hypothetical protein HY897_06685 [Deltaproteobacteria bacterium]|nr:hypothetical protein [Deltaproteobacteria bacterium]